VRLALSGRENHAQHLLIEFLCPAACHTNQRSLFPFGRTRSASSGHPASAMPGRRARCVCCSRHCAKVATTNESKREVCRCGCPWGVHCTDLCTSSSNPRSNPQMTFLACCCCCFDLPGLQGHPLSTSTGSRTPRGSSGLHLAACAAAPAPQLLRAGVPCMGSSSCHSGTS
jgi:hypothetical protein